MQKQLNRLIWRRHRRVFGIVGGLSLLIALANNVIVLHGLGNSSNAHELVGSNINKWQTYSQSDFSAYPFWLSLAFWMLGILLMNIDLKDNFNQFLFSSGFSRRRVYWSKLGMGLAAAIIIVVLTIIVQYGIFWISLPANIGFHLAWPGLITSWVCGLANSIGVFALCWFAALIIGQTGSLVVTLVGFTLSLTGVASIGESLITMSGWKLTGGQVTWLASGVWLLLACILFVWGAYLYRRLSLEHNGEYLLFPGLKVPVYIVFVVYVTTLNAWNASDGTSAVVAFIASVGFGYFWLWRPSIMEKWHQRRSRS